MSDTTLDGRQILVIVTNYGVEQDELLVPVRRLREDGAEVSIAAKTLDPIQTVVGDRDPGEVVEPTITFKRLDPGAYQLLVIPGGTINADQLRMQHRAVETIRAFAAFGRPIAAICHGPWALVEAGVLKEKTLTSYPSLRTDIRNAGAKDWVDEAVVSDSAHGYTLITSRSPEDLDDFLGAIDKALVEL
ncbi:DJ-1/PfpI family protein [Streptomyces fructofermentans]|uniref:Protease n=1 Tax=Streptomyces fructofermentans TaxID=152141 RepID=A0A918U248_9ACTN|nr:DJ-1/PfpI family protein [Streptomyces fructofermentans]GGX81398.1 protease [Streptomyces fructofermentans]